MPSRKMDEVRDRAEAVEEWLRYGSVARRGDVTKRGEEAVGEDFEGIDVSWSRWPLNQPIVKFVQHRAHPRKAEGVVCADLSADGEFR